MYSPHRVHRIATLLAGRGKRKGAARRPPPGLPPFALRWSPAVRESNPYPPSERSRIEYSGTPSSELPCPSASQSRVGSTLGLGVRSSFRKTFLLPVFSQTGIPLNYQSFLQVVLVPPGADPKVDRSEPQSTQASLQYISAHPALFPCPPKLPSCMILALCA